MKCKYSNTMRARFLLIQLTLCAIPLLVQGGTPDELAVRLTNLEKHCDTIDSCQRAMGLQLGTLLKEQRLLRSALEQAHAKNDSLHLALDSLEVVQQHAERRQDESAHELEGRIRQNESSLDAGQRTLRRRTLWGGCIGAVLLGLAAAISVYMRRRLGHGAKAIHEVRKAQEALTQAQAKMQEESCQLDSKLLELIDRQLAAAPTDQSSSADDHALALKVADELVRIELNMSRMDPAIKGYKQLAKAVQRIKDNFLANGYEIVDMLGRPYNEGMKVVANFTVDETLEKGAQVISSITKPQVNYNGKMIQAAQVVVSQNI